MIAKGFSLPRLKILHDHGPASYALLGAGASVTKAPHEATLSRRSPALSQPSPRCRAAEAGAVARSALLAYGAVYAFAQQVGVAVMARVLLDHVVQHPAQRHLPAPRVFLLPEQLEAGCRGHE